MSAQDAVQVDETRKGAAIASIAASVKKFCVKRRFASAQAGNHFEYNVSSAPHRASELVKFCEWAFGVSLAGRDVVDLGCGFGMIGAMLLIEHRVGSVHFVEREPECVAAIEAMLDATGLARGTTTLATLDDFSMPEASVDAILLMDFFNVRTFAHAKLLSACRRALRPGGVFLMRTTNRLTALDQSAMVEYANMLPPAWTNGYVRWRTEGALGYENCAPRATFDLAESLQLAGFANVRTLPTDGYRVTPQSTHRSAPFLQYIYAGAQRVA